MMREATFIQSTLQEESVECALRFSRGSGELKEVYPEGLSTGCC